MPANSGAVNICADFALNIGAADAPVRQNAIQRHDARWPKRKGPVLVTPGAKGIFRLVTRIPN
jgi:hypothetical protein